MDELLGKEKLTYAEKGQLEELQQITEELRIQKDLAEKEESRTQKEVASDALLFSKSNLASTIFQMKQLMSIRAMQMQLEIMPFWYLMRTIYLQ